MRPWSGFLRTRGDRPVSRPWKSRLAAVPPHARRSTRHRSGPLAGRVGSSARAEIDPKYRLIRGIWVGFLRTRGDRPLCRKRPERRARVPPHARRSTWLLSLKITPQRGSSARAEIDPGSTGCYESFSGFLRTRGDRPVAIWLICRHTQVPPHARRSTPKAFSLDAQ